MNEPNAKFQEPFRAISRDLHEPLETAKVSLEAGANLASEWPTLREKIIDAVLPTFKDWVAQIRAVVQPQQLKVLQRRKRALERLVGKTWWHPRGFYLRMRIVLYGMAMGMIILLLLLLGVGVVVGIVYLVTLIQGRS